MSVIEIDPEGLDIFAQDGDAPFKQKLNEFAMQSTGSPCYFDSVRFTTGKSRSEYAALAAIHPFALIDNPDADSPHVRNYSLRHVLPVSPDLRM